MTCRINPGEHEVGCECMGEIVLDSWIELLEDNCRIDSAKEHEQILSFLKELRVLRTLEYVTRLEVIDETGRAYSHRNISIDFHLQDNGKTLKLFIGKQHE